MAIIDITTATNNIPGVVSGAQAGDWIRFAAGTYDPMYLRIPAPQIAMTGAVDGNGNPTSIFDMQFQSLGVTDSIFGDPARGGTPTHYEAMLETNYSDTHFESLKIINSRGRAVKAWGASLANPIRNITMQNMEILNTRHAAVNCRYIEDSVFEDSIVDNSAIFAPYTRSQNEQDWPAACNVKEGARFIWRNNRVTRGWCELVSIGRDTEYCEAIDNIIGLGWMGVYIHKTKHAVAKGNTIFCYDPGSLAYMRGLEFMPGIVCNAEAQFGGGVSTEDILVMNNAFIGTRAAVLCWGGGGSVKSPVIDLKLYNNSVVNLQTRTGIKATAFGFVSSAAHTATARNNLVECDRDSLNDPVQYSSAHTLDFDYNVWSTAPRPAAVGANDTIGSATYVNAGAALDYANIDPDNYKLQGGSVGIGDGTAVAAVTVDKFGATRANPPDAGWHELGGSTALSGTFDATPRNASIDPATTQAVQFTESIVGTVTSRQYRKRSQTGDWVNFTTTGADPSEALGVGIWDIELNLNNGELVILKENFIVINSNEVTDATIYVDGPNGSNSNSGTSASPFKTIQHAVNNAAVGEAIIKVRNGQYSEVVSIARDDLTVENDEGHSPLLTGGWFGTFPVPATTVLPGGDHYDGSETGIYDALLTMTGNNLLWRGIDVAYSSGRGIRVGGSSNSNVTLQDMAIHSNYNRAIHTVDVAGITYDNVAVHDNSLMRDDPENPTGGNYPIAVQNVDCDGVTLQNSRIYNNRGEGVGISQGTLNFAVRYNTFYDNEGASLYLTHSKDGDVTGNRFYQLDATEYAYPAILINWLASNEGSYSPAFDVMNSDLLNNLFVGVDKAIQVQYDGSTYVHGAKDLRIAYNTLVNGRTALLEIDESADHSGNIFEDNVLYQNGGDGVIATLPVSLTGWTFRDNFYSETAPTLMSHAGDIEGGDPLANPNAPITTAHPFALLNYSPSVSASIVDAGVSAITLDILKNTRSTADKGALEYASQSERRAGFEVENTSYTVPQGQTVPVQITDTSVGASTFEYFKRSDPADPWESVSTDQNPLIQLGALTGGKAWSIRQVIDGGVDEIVYNNLISVIAVAAVVTADGADYVRDYIQVAARSGSGNQTFTFDLGGKTPVAIELFMTNATAQDHTAEAAGLFESIGFVMDDGTERAIAIFNEDNPSGNTEVARIQTEDACLQIINKSGADQGQLQFVSVGADQLVANWTDDPAGRIIQLRAHAGADCKAVVATASLSTVDVAVPVTTSYDSEDFRANVVKGISAFTANNTATTAWSIYGYGMAIDDGTTVTQYSIARTSRGGQASVDSRQILSDTYFLQGHSTGQSNRYIEFGGNGVGEFDLTPRVNSISWDVYVLALYIPTEDIWLGTIEAPTLTGPTNPNEYDDANDHPTFEPGYVEIVATRMGAFDTTDNDDDGAIISYYTSEGDGSSDGVSVGTRLDDNSNPAVAKSYASDDLYLKDANGTDEYRGYVNMTDPGLEMIMSTADGDTVYWLALAVGAVEAGIALSATAQRTSTTNYAPATYLLTATVIDGAGTETFLWEQYNTVTEEWNSIGAGRQISRTFSTDGTFKVRVTATPASGAAVTFNLADIVVVPVGIQAFPTTSSGTAPHGVQFTINYDGPDDAAFVWEYNDGQKWVPFGYVRNAYFNFPAGQYEARVGVTLPNGSTTYYSSVEISVAAQAGGDPSVVVRPVLTSAATTSPSPHVLARSPIWHSSNRVIGSLTHKLKSLQFKSEANGGHWSASLALELSQSEMEDWLNHGIGRDVEIYNQAGQIVWNGFVNRMSGSLGGVAVARGPLMDVINVLRVEYRAVSYNTNPPVGGNPKVTPVAVDYDSLEFYGTRQGVFSGGSGTDEEMINIRELFLREKAHPATSVDVNLSGGAGSTLTIELLGYYHMLRSYFYIDTDSVGTVAAGTKLRSVLAADPNQLFTSLDRIEENAVQVGAYETGENTAEAIVKTLNNLGDPDYNRMRFSIQGRRVAVYEKIPDHVSYVFNPHDVSGKLKTPAGAVVEPWDVKVGRWVRVSGLQSRTISGASGLRQDTGMVFIESVDYKAPYGLSLNGNRVSRVDQAVAQQGIKGMS